MTDIAGSKPYKEIAFCFQLLLPSVSTQQVRTPITKVKHIESIYDETYSNKDYLLAYAGGMYIAAGCDRNYNSYSSLYYYEIPNVVADPSQVNVEPKVRNYLNHGDKYFKVKELEVFLVEWVMLWDFNEEIIRNLIRY